MIARNVAVKNLDRGRAVCVIIYLSSARRYLTLNTILLINRPPHPAGNQASMELVITTCVTAEYDLARAHFMSMFMRLWLIKPELEVWITT